jgi:PPOX class probable F420-dependent enzyme
VWYVWDGATFLIYSQPQAHKVRHIQAHPQVALHFNTDATGDTDVVVFTGRAVIDPAAPPANKHRAYLRRYRDGIAALSVENTPAKFAAEYSLALRITPTRLRGW